MTTLISRPKMIALDLCKALVHECGHKVIAKWAGVEQFFIENWLYDDADPEKESLVGGRSHYYPPLNGRNNQLLGIAGYVAEMLASDDMADIDDEDLIDYWDSDAKALSATDLEAAGEVDGALFDDCGKLLRKYWPDLIAAAVHHLNQFQELHAHDDDAVEAASSVRAELEGMRDRFQMDAVA